MNGYMNSFLALLALSTEFWILIMINVPDLGTCCLFRPMTELNFGGMICNLSKDATYMVKEKTRVEVSYFNLITQLSQQVTRLTRGQKVVRKTQRTTIMQDLFSDWGLSLPVLTANLDSDQHFEENLTCSL
jgi:hypothetical protein